MYGSGRGLRENGGCGGGVGGKYEVEEVVVSCGALYGLSEMVCFAIVVEFVAVG